MNKTEKYLEAIKTFDDWITVSVWAEKVSHMFPDLLQEANEQADNHASETTGLRELAARIGSMLSRTGFSGVEIDKSERPRRVKYIDVEERIKLEVESDIEPILREDKISFDTDILTESEKYRIEELKAISKLFNKHFDISLQIDHALALCNQESPGNHHPDNLQLLTKKHNGNKSNKNWQRFSIDEQIEYIRHVIALQAFVASKNKKDLDENILDSLYDRLRQVY